MTPKDRPQELRLEELRKLVKEGFAQIERGECLELSSTEDIVAHIALEDMENEGCRH